jgi:hypothetical protein
MAPGKSERAGPAHEKAQPVSTERRCSPVVGSLACTRTEEEQFFNFFA